MTWATYQEALEWLDNFAADHPLEALRSYAEYLSDYRLGACVIAEPAAALIHAHDRLTPEQRAWCAATAHAVEQLDRFYPDRLAQERKEVIRRRLEGWS